MMMRHSVLLSGIFALLLLPVFAAQAGTGGEGSTMEKEKHHAQWFQKLDKDGDGKISRDEFKEAMGKKFDHMDADGDGFVTKEEWKAAKQKKMERMREHHGGGYGGGQHEEM